MLEELSVSCVIPWGEDSWKLVPCLLWTSSQAPFPFADFALTPFTVVKPSHEYDSMWNPVRSSPSESLNLGMALGIPSAKRSFVKINSEQSTLRRLSSKT